MKETRIDDFGNRLRLAADWVSHYRLAQIVKEQLKVSDDVAENIIRWLIEKKHITPVAGHILRYRRKPRVRVYEGYFRIPTGYVVRGTATLSYTPQKTVYKDLRTLRDEIRESLRISAAGANIVLEHLWETKQAIEIEPGVHRVNIAVALPTRVPTGVEITTRVPEEVFKPIPPLPPPVPPPPPIERVRFIYVFTYLATRAQATGETRHIEIHVEGAVTRDKLDRIGFEGSEGLIPEATEEFIELAEYHFIYEKKGLEAEPHSWEDRTEAKPVADDELKILDVHLYDYTYGTELKCSSRIVDENWSDWTPEKLAEELKKAPEFYSMIGLARTKRRPPSEEREARYDRTTENIERMKKKLEEFKG